MRTQTTERLFYGKWPFKIECTINGAGHIAKAGTDRVLAWTYGDVSLPKYRSLHHTRKSEVGEFALAVKKYEDHDIKTRAELNTYSIFCKDKALLDDIKNDLAPWISCITQPETEEQYLFLTNEGKKKVICSAYPRKEYQYKIIFRTSIPLENRISFLNWIEKTNGKVFVSGTTKSWFQGNGRWMQEPFCYVKDAQTLTMVMLFIGNHHRTVYEYILKSSINS